MTKKEWRMLTKGDTVRYVGKGPDKGAIGTVVDTHCVVDDKVKLCVYARHPAGWCRSFGERDKLKVASYRYWQFLSHGLR